jgi:hypothetical protein
MLAPGVPCRQAMKGHFEAAGAWAPFKTGMKTKLSSGQYDFLLSIRDARKSTRKKKVQSFHFGYPARNVNKCHYAN